MTTESLPSDFTIACAGASRLSIREQLRQPWPERVLSDSFAAYWPTPDAARVVLADLFNQGA